MRVHETALPGVVIIEPRVFKDSRGFFFESWHHARYEDVGIHGPFVQDNHSLSLRGTLRGLHWQWRRPQGKLVRVVEGEIYDVAVDIRPEAPTFGQWVGVTMRADDFTQFYVPPGFAHGFCVVSNVAQVEYKCTDYYDAEGEQGLIWNDPDLAIAWPVAAPILSDRDSGHPTLQALFGQGPAGR